MISFPIYLELCGRRFLTMSEIETEITLLH